MCCVDIEHQLCVYCLSLLFYDISPRGPRLFIVFLGGGGTVVLAPILEIGSSLPPEEYSRAIVPCVVSDWGCFTSMACMHCV